MGIIFPFFVKEVIYSTSYLRASQKAFYLKYTMCISIYVISIYLTIIGN